MFFREMKKNNTPFPQGKDHAKSLNKAIKKIGKIKRPFSLSTWEKSFVLLFQRDDVPADRIKRVLDWYIEHIGQPFVPECFSAKSFREKFLQIESAMRRMNPELEYQDQKIPPIIKDIVRRLNQMEWPGVHTEQMQIAVLQSYNNIEHLRQSLHILQLKGAAVFPSKEIHHTLQINSDSSRRFATYILNQTMSPSEFTFEHFRAQNWRTQVASWSRSVMDFKYENHGLEFEKLGRKWCVEYFGTDDRWNTMHELIAQSIKLLESNKGR